MERNIHAQAAVSARVSQESQNRRISANAVRDLCGGISDMSLWRWLADPALEFPRPIHIARRRYWREAEVLAWLDRQADAQRGAG
jgi:predicted DNA-binding transcriptional regulator AlpA